MANRARPRTHTVRHGYQTLHNTSQGRIFDLPPDKWIDNELIRFGAFRDDGRAQIPRLAGTLHPVFARGNWRGISDRRYKALEQSMLLASKLIDLSGAAFASGLPKFRQNPKRSTPALAVPLPDYAPSPDSKKRVKVAKASFVAQAPNIQWVEDKTMMEKHGWLGINTPWQNEPPLDPADPMDWEDIDGEDKYGKGKDDDWRGVLIGITSAFADGILRSDPGTQEHLWTVFYAGVTMAHELGHWLFTRIMDQNPGEGEPYFGDNVEMEMGNAFIGWLFGGFRPDMIWTTKSSIKDFKIDKGMCWVPMHNCGDTKPVYQTKYSISIGHVERIMDEQEWQHLFHLIEDHPGVLRATLLRPERFRRGETARIAEYYKNGSGSGTLDEASFAGTAHKRFIDYEAAPFAYVDLLWNPKAKEAAGAPMQGVRVEKSISTRIKNLQKKIAKLCETLGKQREQLRNASTQFGRDIVDLTSEPGSGFSFSKDLQQGKANPSLAKQHSVKEQIRETSEKIAEAAQQIADLLGDSGDPTTAYDTKKIAPRSKKLKHEDDGRHGVPPSSGGQQDIRPGHSSSEAMVIDSDDKETSVTPAQVPFHALPKAFQNLIMRLNDMHARPEKYADERPDVNKDDKKGKSTKGGGGKTVKGLDDDKDDEDDDDDDFPEDEHLDPDPDGPIWDHDYGIPIFPKFKPRPTGSTGKAKRKHLVDVEDGAPSRPKKKPFEPAVDHDEDEDMPAWMKALPAWMTGVPGATVPAHGGSRYQTASAEARARRQREERQRQLNSEWNPNPGETVTISSGSDNSVEVVTNPFAATQSNPFGSTRKKKGTTPPPPKARETRKSKSPTKK